MEIEKINQLYTSFWCVLRVEQLLTPGSVCDCLLSRSFSIFASHDRDSAASSYSNHHDMHPRLHLPLAPTNSPWARFSFPLHSSDSEYLIPRTLLEMIIKHAVSHLVSPVATKLWPSCYPRPTMLQICMLYVPHKTNLRPNQPSSIIQHARWRVCAIPPQPDLLLLSYCSLIIYSD